MTVPSDTALIDEIIANRWVITHEDREFCLWWRVSAWHGDDLVTLAESSDLRMALFKAHGQLQHQS